MLLISIAVISLLSGALVCLGCDAFLSLNWIWLLPVSTLGFFLLLAALLFAFVLYLCKRVDQSVPQEDDSKFYRIVANLIVRSALPFLRIRVKHSGTEKVPTDGRFLLVCNHCNDSDPIILLYCLHKSQLAFISKRENSTMFVIGPMMHKILCQLINRENDREALKTILNCIKILDEDKASVAVFPEGGIRGGHVLHPLRNGVFKIAQRAKVPVVVCTLRDTHTVLKKALKLQPSQVELRLVGVIGVDQIAGKTAVQIGDMVYKMMADDLGPELVLQQQDT